MSTRAATPVAASPASRGFVAQAGTLFEAIQWAERVEYEAARELLLVRIARAWLSQDEEAAEAWLSQSSLSERAREEARDTTRPTYLPEASPR